MIKQLSLVALLGFFSGQTCAVIWSPTGEFTFSGYLELQWQFFCSSEVSGSGRLDGSTAIITSLSIEPIIGGFCYTVVEDLPYELTASDPESVTIKNVRLWGVWTGGYECIGDLSSVFEQATGEISFDMAILTVDTPGNPPCQFDGILYPSPQISFNFP
ncbi:hypothetical protein [Microbulbifer spongiae]|uniref:Uncharacterized protein n=1 Tax=Microbulbifer spongiae TaxID=2944933 RepID=A0ABY9EGN8_9GAMM|nr:hypothetical protein [Microbulbifer sp. MI-G]WKD51256.1 hypothetical protein M8T91_07520 [Microbulbifer sp. MI-G]